MINKKIIIPSTSESKKFFRISVCGDDYKEIRDFMEKIADCATFNCLSENESTKSIAELIERFSSETKTDSLPKCIILKDQDAKTDIMLDASIYFDTENPSSRECVEHLVGSDACIEVPSRNFSLKNTENEIDTLTWESRLVVTNFSAIPKVFKLCDEWRELTESEEISFARKSELLFEEIKKAIRYLEAVNPCNTPEKQVSSMKTLKGRCEYALCKYIKSSACKNPSDLTRYVVSILKERE